MDFAFVPGITPYEQRLQRAMQNRSPQTTLINDSGVVTVVDFLNQLVAQNRKGGDLLLGAHASRNDFVMSFDATTSSRADYETVEALGKSGTVHIPAGVRSANTSVHLKGCRIGDTAKPLLTVIKAALDNPQQLTAPRFLHSLSDDAGQGIVEFMSYAYEVTATNATNLGKRADLVAAFQSPPKPFMQGVEKGQPQVQVPSANFEKWLPSQAQLDSLTDKVLMPISINLDPPVVRRNPATNKDIKITVITNVVGFDAFPDSITWPIDMTGRTVPADKAGKIALLQSLLQQDPKWMFPPSHPFPYYVRYGFSNFNDFFSAFDWDSTLITDGSKQTLNYVGTRSIYRLEIPVTTNTGTLIYNYYPNSGTPVMNFKEDNKTYEMFGVV